MAGENLSVNDLARKVYLRGMTTAQADGDQTDAGDDDAATGILVTTVAGGSGGAVTLTDGTDTALITTAGAVHTNLAQIAGTTVPVGVGSGATAQRVAAVVHDGTDTLLITSAGAATTDLTTIAGTAASTGVGASGAGTQRVASLIHDGTETALVTTAGNLQVQTGVGVSGFSFFEITAATTGTTVDMGAVCSNAVMILRSSAALTSTDLVVLQGSMNGDVGTPRWYNLAQTGAITTDFAAAGTRAYGSVAPPRPFRYLRVVVGTVLADRTTVTATAITGGDLSAEVTAN